MRLPGVTILTVEDEGAVLEVIRRTLERAGYRVLVAASPEVAISLSVEHADSIELLILDVIMPELTGPQLRKRLQPHLGDVPTMYISGYTGNELSSRGIDDTEIALLGKPFTPAELLTHVRRLLSVFAVNRMRNSGLCPQCY
jgi:DNA-binding response OmpR family regulator